MGALRKIESLDEWLPLVTYRLSASPKKCIHGKLEIFKLYVSFHYSGRKVLSILSVKVSLPFPRRPMVRFLLQLLCRYATLGIRSVA